jgi:anti-anti-sigma regulatory factor
MPAQDRPALIILPAEIGTTNASRLSGELGSALASGASVVIADVTATTVCHSSGARVLVLACAQAAANGIELRPVVRSTAALVLAGLDGLLPVCPALSLAHAAEPASGRQE